MKSSLSLTNIRRKEKEKKKEKKRKKKPPYIYMLNFVQQKCPAHTDHGYLRGINEMFKNWGEINNHRPATVMLPSAMKHDALIQVHCWKQKHYNMTNFQIQLLKQEHGLPQTR